jgi:hypothetical protein
MVDFPEAERPVNQTVAPFCLRRSVRSSRVRPACQVMLLSRLLGFALDSLEADGGVVE